MEGNSYLFQTIQGCQETGAQKLKNNPSFLLFNLFVPKIQESIHSTVSLVIIRKC